MFWNVRFSIDESNALRRPGGGPSKEYDGRQATGRDDFAGVGKCRVPRAGSAGVTRFRNDGNFGAAEHPAFKESVEEVSVECCEEFTGAEHVARSVHRSGDCRPEDGGCPSDGAG